MRVTLDLNEDLLGEHVLYLHQGHRAIEDDIDDLEELSAVFQVLIERANDVLEWVAQAKASLARQGVAA
ncbi:MAG: hypothetical protein EKK60_16920 [Gordonia sp. (in: high G+C Gram-positive bacteria)]|nr:MAG: hypothetical protein EKK60_16920 [Gordonia sp. (in: high G+C Gram-positive bacteria)]